MSFSSLILSKKIFVLLLLSLPINLGLHFIGLYSYVGGLLIDYLVPTIFVQDMLAVALLGVWFYEKRTVGHIFSRSPFAILTTLLLYVTFLSVFLSPRLVVSVYAFVRWLLYAGVGLYISENFSKRDDLPWLYKIFAWWSVVLGVLAILQFAKQGAVFNNYLVLGEQPYSYSTPLIDKENFFGLARVPAYGLFRHPNIFGGVLVIFLTVIIYGYRTKHLLTKLFFPAIGLGIIGLFFTLSYFAWLAFILGVILLFVKRKSLVELIFVAVSSLGFFIHKLAVPQFLLDNPSFYKRVDLLEAGYLMIHYARYLFGVGLNASTLLIEVFTLPTKFIRFVQPTHNIFVLLASEVGLIGLALFFALFVMSLLHARRNNTLVFVVLLEIILLGSFDHYFLTMHQTFLLLWVFFGIANKKPVV